MLQLIAEGRNVKEIGGLLGISARTAETHRGRIMGKLDIHDVAGLVRYAIVHGLTTLEDPPQFGRMQVPAQRIHQDGRNVRRILPAGSLAGSPS